MRSPLLAFALGILALGLPVSFARAATAGASFGVSVTVQASCLASASSTAFRSYAAATNAASSVSITCSNSNPYAVSLLPVLAPAPNVTLPAITGSGAAMLATTHSSNPTGAFNRRQAIGSARAPAFTPNPSPNLASVGRFSAAQFSALTPFTDTVTVVVTY